MAADRPERPFLQFLRRNAGTLVLACVFVAFAGLIYWPITQQRRPKAKSSMCLSNMKQLGLAMTQYTAEYDDHFPPANTWNDALSEYVKNPVVFVCTEMPPEWKVPTYAMNRRMSGVRMQDVSDPKNVVLLFDSKPGRNRLGGAGMLPDPPRHNKGDYYLFADGHAKWISRRSDVIRLGILRWNPGPAAHPKSP